MTATVSFKSGFDTSLLTAYFRALETDRPDAHFCDPFARMLAGERGPELVKRLPAPSLTAASCIVRTCVLDELIIQGVAEDGIDTVVNLGAGLDMRPHRLPLPPSLTWIEVDGAEVLAYKKSKLAGCAPTCTLEAQHLDITDADERRRFLDRLCERANRALVLAEGLLTYLTREQVACLASDLRARPQFKWWLTDIVSSTALQLMGSRTETGLAPCPEVRLQFAPEEGADFFQPYGWNAVEFRSYEEESRRLNRWELPPWLLLIHVLGWPWLAPWLHAIIKLERAE
jgi:methyltransferase (TIGR00027 family)